MDQWTRKQMTMHKTLHPRDDVDRLYVSRKEGGVGLVNIEDSIEDCIIQIGQNTDMIPGDLRWQAVTQTPVKDHQWTLMIKTLIIRIGALSTITKNLKKNVEIRGRIKTVQITASLKSAKILILFLETWEDKLSLKLLWNTISERWWEKLTRSNNNNYNQVLNITIYSYLPTPTLGQDMTQGRFFKRSLTGLNSEFSFS